MTSSEHNQPVEGATTFGQWSDGTPKTRGDVEGVSEASKPLPPAVQATAMAAAETVQNPDQYAVTAWGQFDKDFTCPSGQRCRVRQLQFHEVMAGGLLDTLNTLQGVVSKGVRKGQGQPPLDAMKLLQDKKTSKQFADVVDQVVCMVVTVPKVHPLPDDGLRKDGVVYVDTIGFMDKMEIFTEALGAVKELERFRGESVKLPPGVADEPGDEVSP